MDSFGNCRRSHNVRRPNAILLAGQPLGAGRRNDLRFKLRPRLVGLTLTLILASGVSLCGSNDTHDVIQKVKSVDRSLGYKPTGNFTRRCARTVSYSRSYFTGVRELPASYDELRMRKGAKDGCSINQTKYDVFF